MTAWALLPALLWGCSRDSYRGWADLQVHALLADRMGSTLDYQPEYERDSTAGATPLTGAVYQKLPFTRVAPAAPSPIEVRRVEYDFGPLGPPTALKNAPAEVSTTDVMELTMRRLRGGQTLGPPSPDHAPLRLDLFGCLQYAVTHSRAYQDQLDALYLAALEVTLQRHLFDPTPFANTRLQYTGAGRPDSDIGYQSAVRAVNTVGVRQNLPWGGQVTAQAVHTLVDTITGQAIDGHTVQLVLQGSMPLLKDFGMVNLEGLIQSERTLVYQIRAFEDYRRQFVVSTASSYFQLLSLQTSVTNRRLNLRNLDMLTERTKAFYQAGMQNFLEVQRSMQSRLQAESALVSAEEQYITALDNFKVVLGMPPEQDFDVVELRLDVEVPAASEEAAIALAERYRLDLQTARDRVADARRAIENAARGLLPDLTVDGRVAVGDTGELGDLRIDHRTAEYQTGVTLALPLDQLAQRNTYRRALINADQASRRLQQLRDQIASDVRQSLRAISVAQTNYAIQRRGIDLAASRLEFANEQMRLGKATAREVVEAQQSLLDAQDQASRAYSTLQSRVLEYLRNTGTLRVDPQAGSIGQAMDRARAAEVMGRLEAPDAR